MSVIDTSMRSRLLAGTIWLFEELGQLRLPFFFYLLIEIHYIMYCEAKWDAEIHLLKCNLTFLRKNVKNQFDYGA